MKTKRNASIVPTVILEVLGLILTVVLVSFILSTYKQTKAATQDVYDSLKEKSRIVSSSESLEDLNGAWYDGSEVINFCSRYLGDRIYDAASGVDQRADISVYVIHSGPNTTNQTEYYNSRYLNAMKDPNDAHYIKASSQWTVSVQRNINGVVTTVIFTQK